tara:strand:+ start:1294 stop:1482 length:189 start_codon:yes stop_codon:yes gene_type:complete
MNNIAEFLRFVDFMFHENREEKYRNGEEPYNDIWDYLNSNTHFLEKKFYKMKSDRWVDERKD